MADFYSCVSSAVGSGTISKDEAEALSRRYSELEKIAMKSRSKTAKELLSDELTEARVRKKRLDYLAVKAQDQIQKDIKGWFLLAGKADLAGAIVRLFENFGDAGYSSVRGRTAALIGQAQTELADMLSTFRRSKLTMQRFNRPMLNDIVRVAFGETSSAEAKAFYDSFSKVSEKLRAKFNAAGGDIGWRKDWGLPQSHNAAAILTAGKERWTAFINDRIDWEKMESPLTRMPIPVEDRPAVLDSVWENIVTGGWKNKQPSRQAGGVSLANRRSDPRFFKFKDAQSWLEYNKQFGAGDVYEAMMGHIRGMSKDIAMMERFGPNPAATKEWLKQVVEKEAANTKIGKPSFLDAEPGNADTRAKTAINTIDALYDIARGSGVPENWLSIGSGTTRNIAYSAKIGAAVITHSFSNTVIQAMGRYLHGLPMMTVIPDIIRNLGTHEEMLQAGIIAEDVLHTMELGARERASASKLRELSSWLPAWTTHYSGLNAIVNSNRRAFASSAMATFASNVGKRLGELEPRLQQFLKSYGISAQDWDVMRLADLHTGPGAPFLRSREIERLAETKAKELADILGIGEADTDRLARAADKVALKYLEMLHQATEVAVPSSNWRVRAQIISGRPEGTLMGEAVRSAAMFKAGFMATFMLTQRDMLVRELATNKASTAAYIGASAIALTLSGLAVLQLKNAINGKDFMPTDPTTKQGRATWMHAALTSGALGIYGDFLHSSESHFGHGLAETLLGPQVTGAIDAVQSSVQGVKNVAGYVTGEKQKATPLESGESAAIKMFRNNTPVLSTHWALRAAYNRMVLDQLQYLSDPQAHQKFRRMERTIQSETGQKFWWPRGEMTPSRLPQPSTALE